MSLKVLGDRFRARQAPAAVAPATPAAPSADLERAQRSVAAANAKAERSAKAEAAALKSASEAQARADAQLLDATVSSAAARARVLNPSQVAALVRDRYELVGGKVVPRSDATLDLDADLGAWLAVDGKHFLPAAVPGGGSGAPANPTPPKQGAPHDLTTDAGKTAYARERYASAVR